MDEIYDTIAHVHTADGVVSQVETLILEGVLRVGDRLPAERELARRMDVSRPILREALKTLEAKGLLVTRAGDGTRVADVVGEVFSAPLRGLIADDPRASADYLEFRREIEAVAAEMAARQATAHDHALIAAIVERMEAAHAAGDFEAEAATDIEFHGAVGECAHNIVLLHTLRACYRLLADGVFYNRRAVFGLPGARDALLAQHKAIADAICRGDGVAAGEAARAHMDFVRDGVARVQQSGERARVARLRLAQRLGLSETRKGMKMEGTSPA